MPQTLSAIRVASSARIRASARRQPSPAQARIVGIGASAGGFEALENFLSHLPDELGMAFVIVLHLDPKRKGMLPELLQACTRMPVLQAVDRALVLPNHVYVIAPNSEILLRGGRLVVRKSKSRPTARLPIDLLFRSLAEDQGDRSVGIIFSGMGTDGTLGAAAIKEREGLLLVQTVRDAKFGSMPRSVIESGLADITGTAAEIAHRLAQFFERSVDHEGMGLARDLRSADALKKIVRTLQQDKGHDFSLYRGSTLFRRASRRMVLRGRKNLPAYARYLERNAAERTALFKDLLIGVTNFFRDGPVWERLRRQVLPRYFARQKSGSVLRAWVAGCSTGEEAYSLAMVFKEALGDRRNKEHLSLQIFATDLDADAVERARRGIFPPNISSDVSKARLARFFTKDERGYRLAKEIREMVIFASQNLIMDPPFINLDLLTCRNLLIYLTPELQKKVFPIFHYALKPDGILVLGSAESVGAAGHKFTSLASAERIFQCHKPSDMLVEAPATRCALPEHPSVMPESNGALARKNSKSRKHFDASASSANDRALRSTIQELQSSNEELQSTNEEITTSKEEMQSLNEELQTVNAELQAKIEELANANNDMRNLLNSTEVATLFLDRRLVIRRFTPPVRKVIRMLAHDVGRPLSDLHSDLIYPSLASDSRRVLRTGKVSEKAVASDDGRWFSIRIMPYRTVENRLDGIVVTFVDITVAKKLEAELRANQATLEKVSRRQQIELDRRGKSALPEC